MYAKGLSGRAHLFGTSLNGLTPVTNWKVMLTNSPAVGTAPPVATAPGWNNYQVGADAFNKHAGYAWVQTTLPNISSTGAEIAAFSSVDDNCWVYLNGTMLATNYGWNIPFDVDLTKAWAPSGPNVLTVLIQNKDNTGGLDSAVNFIAYQSETPLNDWVQHGGPGDPDSTTDWQTLENGKTFGGPQFFQATFTASPFETTGANPMWRIITSGLSRGSIWVNGHNLGRYPETISAPGMYLPECWLKPGTNANKLVIYDESGNLPTQVRVQSEAAASRDVVTFQSEQTVTASEH
jgi:beta-galactosidase